MPNNTPAATASRLNRNGALILGTGLAFASLKLIPALASRFGMGTPLAGALRIAFMRASSRVASIGSGKAGSQGEGETAPVCFGCH